MYSKNYALLWSFEYSDRKLYNGVYKNNEER